MNNLLSCIKHYQLAKSNSWFDRIGSINIHRILKWFRHFNSQLAFEQTTTAMANNLTPPGLRTSLPPYPRSSMDFEIHHPLSLLSCLLNKKFFAISRHTPTFIGKPCGSIFTRERKKLRGSIQSETFLLKSVT